MYFGEQAGRTWVKTNRKIWDRGAEERSTRRPQIRTDEKRNEGEMITKS